MALSARTGLSRDIDITVSRVSEIVRGERVITADTAPRLAEYFGTSAELGFVFRRITICGSPARPVGLP